MVAVEVRGEDRLNAVKIDMAAQQQIDQRRARVDEVMRAVHLEHGAGAVAIGGGHAVAGAQKGDFHSVTTPFFRMMLA